MVQDEHRDRYGRRIAVAVVLTTMIAALVGFAQSAALRTHDKADARAETNGALALEAAAVNRGRAQVQIDRFNLLTQQIRAANNATAFGQFGTGSEATRLEAARWGSIASQTEADTVTIAKSQGIAFICAPSFQKHCTKTDASYSPEQDPSFPQRFMQQSQWSAYYLTALRDAANQEADDAEAKFVHYAAALTMLAVAVFLFGYSLTPQGRSHRRLFSVFAIGFVSFASVWSLFQGLTPVSHPSDQAARDFANGEVQLDTGNYRVAITDFDQTLKLRPRFVDAYYDRAQAEFGAGFPQVSTDATSEPTTAGQATIPSVAAIQAAVGDDEQARGDGSDSATLLGDLGKDLFYLGVIKHSASDLEQSHKFLVDSVDQLNTESNVTSLLADAYLRMAEDDLVLGNPGSGREYDLARSELTQPTVSGEQTVATSLTDLSLIQLFHPALASKVVALNQQMVATGEANAQTPTGDAPSAHDRVQLGGITAEPDPGHALYTISKVGTFDPRRDVMSVQWEYKDPLHGEWAVLPQISGAVQKGGLLNAQTLLVSNNISYVSDSEPATCLPPGQYRVQLYVNGYLAGSATATGSWSPLHAVRFSDVDGAMCVPNGWVALPDASAGTGGYLEQNGKGGAVIFSIPEAAVAPIANDQSALAGVMQAALGGFSGPGNFLPTLKQLDKPQDTPFFMSSNNGQEQDWSYQNGGVLSGVGTSSNGEVYIGIAWGPPSGNLQNELFLSLSPT